MKEEIKIHALILTLNEERHLARCIDSIKGECASITVIDSGSSDRTIEIAQSHGVSIIKNKWVNYATQMNFAIDACGDCDGWILRIDADEILDSESKETLVKAVRRLPEGVDGLLVRRRIYFLGRRIKHGAIEPSWQLRVWRNGKGRCEQRWMDEHIKVVGEVIKSGVILSDINLNSLTWWIAKHNSYASREAVDFLSKKYGLMPADILDGSGVSGQARRRRIFKERIYSKVPGGLRAVLYFLYRYIARFGFLDGREGWYFHVLQGLWYRTLVDAKVREIEAFAAAEGVSIVDAIENKTGIALYP